MVRTSMLPVSGTNELSAIPNKTRPHPPNLRSRTQVEIASSVCKCGSIRVRLVYSAESTGCEVRLNHRRLRRIEKEQLRRRWQRTALLGILIEELHALQARRI